MNDVSDEVAGGSVQVANTHKPPQKAAMSSKTSKVIMRPTLLQAFSRSQVGSIAATVADFGLLFLMTEVFHIWYVIAVASGAVSGAVTNFIVNRQWSFAATHEQWQRQAMRYTVVSAASLLLNTGGVWLVTEYLKIHYSISVLFVSLIVGFLFNFPLQRGYVFK